MNDSLISVIIPTYNYAAYVCEAVDSALAQTYTNLEVIVVDSGNDDTPQRLAGYGDRIRYFHQPPRGLSAARNLAIREARGEWVALLDADDVWHPQKLEVQLRAAANSPNCVLLASADSPEMPSCIAARPAVRPLSACDFLTTTPFGPSGAVLRRSTLLEVGLFNESLPAVEDREMWLKLVASFPCIFVDSPCWWYRLHEAQMSRNSRRNHDCYRRVLRRFFKEHPEFTYLRRMAWSQLYADSAWAYFAEGKRAHALAFLACSFWFRPAGSTDSFGGRPWRRTRSLLRYVLGTRLCQFLRPSVR